MRHRTNLLRHAQFQPMMLFQPRRSTHGTGTLGGNVGGDLRRRGRLVAAPGRPALYCAGRQSLPLGLPARPAGQLGVPGRELDGSHAATGPARPDQSTISRRTRRADFWQFLQRVGERMAGKPPAAPAAPALVKVVDGKPLELPNHTTDRDATWGRCVSRTGVGYKLHAVFSPGNPMPDAFAVTTLNVCEKRMAARMVKRIAGLG